MAYATVADMVERFGLIEMIRLSSRDNALTEAVDGPRVENILADVSAVIDSLLRKRYAVPLNPVPREILRCCCILARHDLAQGGEQKPSAEMVKERDQQLEWLASMASSEGGLDCAPASTASDARVQDRERDFTGVGLP